MARNNLGRNFTGQTPRSKGSFLIRDNDGKFVAQKWPKPRGKAKTPYDYYRQQEFKIAGRMASNAIAEDIFTAWEMTKGTQQVPRDFITMCIFGSAYELVEEDGFVWPTFRSMAPNPQYMLDLITVTTGSMIYRADIGWVGLDPGNAGKVLTMHDGAPQWRNPPVTPQALTKITTLKRTTNQANTSSALHVCAWEAADIDELGIWNPANPTRVVFPAGYSRIRVSTTLRWPGFAVNGRYGIETRRNDGSISWFGAIRNQLTTGSSFSTQREVTSIGPWALPPTGTYFEVQVSSLNIENWGFLANSSVTIEATE